MMIRVGNEFFPLSQITRIAFEPDGTAKVTFTAGAMRVSNRNWVQQLLRHCEEMSGGVEVFTRIVELPEVTPAPPPPPTPPGELSYVSEEPPKPIAIAPAKPINGVRRAVRS